MSYGTQSLHRLVQRKPQAIATIDGARRRDWQAVSEAVARFAGALVRSGIEPGDRVALLSNNADICLDFVLGAFWAGAVINPVNTRWSPAEIAYSLDDCGTRILVVSEAFADLIEPIRATATSLERIVLIGDERDGVESFDRWIEAAAAVDDLRIGGSQLAAILYTGGTTGRPKGVMLSHANLLASANGYYGFPDARPGASYLHVAPLFHIGSLSGMFASLLAGSTQVFLPGFDSGRLIETVDREKVSDLFLVPTMLRALLNDPGFSPERLVSIERIVYGASAIDDTLLDRAMALLPSVGFVQAYGMTELSPIATMLGPEDHSIDARKEGRGRSAGRATTACEVRIVDSADQEVERGTAGEIVVRGGGVMLGYWGMAAATSEALRGGWMHTGDIGRMDVAGYVTVVDRLKDMIVSGGENIYSAEVENALASHPDVRQVAVIGVPHPAWGEAVHAVVVLHDGATVDVADLRAHCRAQIAGYKVPKTIAFLDTLPLSPAGKILKTALRSMPGA